MAAGVWVTSAERLSVAVPAVVAAALAAGLGRRFGLAALGAVVLPTLALEAVPWLPTDGKLRVHVDATALVVLGVALAGCAVALRSRVGRVVAALLVVGTGVLAGARRVDGLRGGGVEAPPIVLLTLDTLRADHLAGFGGDVDVAHTPHLDAFFRTARVFRAAYAPLALTGPSHTSMLSGRGVEAHQVTVNGQTLPDGLPWVPEELRAAGWRTRAAVSAAVLDASLGFGRGFDRYDSAFEERTRRAFAFLNLRGYRPRAGSTENRPGRETLALVAGFEPGTFTWVHLYDAHWPYTPTPEAGRRVGLASVEPVRGAGLGRQIDPSERAWPADEVARTKLLYRAEIEDLDRLVGEALARIPAGATVILAGDHGESLDEHGYYFSHGRLPFAPDVHTLLAVRSPGLAPEWVDTPVSLARIADTLRAAAGLGASRGLLGPIDDTPVLSLSYTSNFLGPRVPDHPLGPLAGVALRERGRSTVWTRWHDAAAYAPADPRELSPLPVDADEQAALQRVAGGAGAAGEPEPEMRHALEALGYLDGGP